MTAYTEAIFQKQLPITCLLGTRRRNSSEKFSRNVSCVSGFSSIELYPRKPAKL
jgi:hypothetical protein